MSAIQDVVLKRFPNFIPVVEVISGSHLYGTNTEHSDTDTRGIFIPSKEYFFGYLHNVEQIEDHNNDTTFFEIKKFFKLCVDCNPNIVELLFVPESQWILSSHYWDRIIENRDLFLSKKAKYTFSGYATSQLHRIKNHRNWLLHPVKKQPKRSDFGLPDNKTLVTKDQLNAYDELKSNYNLSTDLNPNFLEILEHEKAYLNANREWNSYQKWLRERNPARAKLEEKSGYDTKHASHLVRLLKEGEELLIEGTITFPRPEASYLLDIINGRYTYDELMSMIGDIDARFDIIYKQSILPNSPERERADDLCQELTELSYKLRL